MVERAAHLGVRARRRRHRDMPPVLPIDERPVPRRREEVLVARVDGRRRLLARESAHGVRDRLPVLYVAHARVGEPADELGPAVAREQLVHLLERADAVERPGEVRVVVAGGEVGEERVVVVVGRRLADDQQRGVAGAVEHAGL